MAEEEAIVEDEVTEVEEVGDEERLRLKNHSLANIIASFIYESIALRMIGKDEIDVEDSDLGVPAVVSAGVTLCVALHITPGILEEEMLSVFGENVTDDAPEGYVEELVGTLLALASEKLLASLLASKFADGDIDGFIETLEKLIATVTPVPEPGDVSGE